MKKKLHELTREEYDTLYRSGFMGEFYPDASGCYEKDVEEYQHKLSFVAHHKDTPVEELIPADILRVPYPVNRFDWGVPVKMFDLTRQEFEEIANELAEERMNVIGQNGNDGEHYKQSFEELMEDYDKWFEKNVDEPDAVTSPNHYFIMGKEAIEIIRASLTKEQFKGYCLGNVLKYRLRAGKKGNAKEDLSKALEYEKIWDKYSDYSGY